MLDERQLIEAAERAYERGRFWWALRVAALVIPLVAISAYFAPNPWVNVVCGGLLLAAAAVLRFRGRGLANAVDLGLMGGAAAYLMPLVAASTGGGCSVVCWTHCLAACTAGGLIAGGFIGLRVMRNRDTSLEFIGGAVIVAGLCGSLGCAPFGGVGVVAMAVGIALTSALVVAAGQRLAA